MKRIALALIVAILAVAFSAPAEACHRRPLRKGLKAIARLVLPCR